LPIAFEHLHYPDSISCRSSHPLRFLTLIGELTAWGSVLAKTRSASFSKNWTCIGNSFLARRSCAKKLFIDSPGRLRATHTRPRSI
jgi:hypothetical protein